MEEEAESAAQYQRLVQNTTLHARGAAGLMTDPELSLMLDWQQKRRPTAAWGQRYRRGFDVGDCVSRGSRKARDSAIAAEKERQQRELRRTRLVAAVLGTAFLLAVGFAGYALYEQRRASVEQAARQQAEQLREAQQKLTEEQERGRKQAEELNQKLTVALDETQKAKAAAEAADARAEHEAEVATRTAQMFITAIKAQASAQLAAFEELEKMESSSRIPTLKKAHPCSPRTSRKLTPPLGGPRS